MALPIDEAKKTAITREDILSALKGRLEPLDFTLSLYEGGAAAWGRVDRWSDIDLGLELAPGRLEEAFAAVTAALKSIAPVEFVFDVPHPPSAAQKLYRLEGSSPFLIVDLCFDERDPKGPAPEGIEREVHGEIVCHFDKTGVPQYRGLDREALNASLAKRLAVLPVQFELFKTMPRKELNRGHWVEALVFYHNAILRLLVELLRIRHKPVQSGFHTRYIYYDFPADVVQRLEALYFVSDPEDLGRKLDEAELWFRELVAAVTEEGAP